MDIFSNLQVIDECLLDKKRTDFFLKILKFYIRKNHIVLDAGTGSGILAMSAKQNGAKEVYAVEIAPDVAQIANEHFKQNNLNIKLINDDVTSIKLNILFNVVVMEMLDTGLIAEQQCQAINNLFKNAMVDEKTIFIPSKIDSYIELINYDFNFYGFYLPHIIQARNYGVNNRILNKLSRKFKYESINFSKKIKTVVNKEIQIVSNTAGIANAVRIKSRIWMDNKFKTFGTSDMNMPVIIPIESIKLKRGQQVKIMIKYIRGEGFNKLRINCNPYE